MISSIKIRTNVLTIDFDYHFKNIPGTREFPGSEKKFRFPGNFKPEKIGCANQEYYDLQCSIDEKCIFPYKVSWGGSAWWIK